MRHAGICHMSKTRPQVATSAAGTWSVSLRVFDRQGPHQVEPWLILFSGDAAREWWEREGRTLEPGDTLRVVLERARVHTVAGDRHGTTSELHAHVIECQLAARAKKAQEASA